MPHTVIWSYSPSLPQLFPDPSRFSLTYLCISPTQQPSRPTWVAQIFLDARSSTIVWLTCQEPHFREHWLCLTQRPLIADSSMARSGILCPAPSLAGMWSGLGLHGSYTCCRDHSEFTCAVALLCSEDTVSLEPFTSCPHTLSFPSSMIKILSHHAEVEDNAQTHIALFINIGGPHRMWWC